MYILLRCKQNPPYKVTIVNVPSHEIENGREFYKVGLQYYKKALQNKEKYLSKLCVNSDGSNVFAYVTPTFMHYKIDRFKN